MIKLCTQTGQWINEDTGKVLMLKNSFRDPQEWLYVGLIQVYSGDQQELLQIRIK